MNVQVVDDQCRKSRNALSGCLIKSRIPSRQRLQREMEENNFEPVG